MDLKVTVRRLRDSRNLDGSRFLKLYEKFVLSRALTNDEYQELLSFAVIFLRQGDQTVQVLAYRIILQYSLDTADFEPLIALADQREIMPILHAIRKTNPGAIDDNELRNVLSQAHGVNFTQGGITRTREQLALQQFNRQHEQALIVAPTSYGKSEMLIDRAQAALPGTVCIIVPTKALIAQTKAELIRAANQLGRATRIITHPEAFNNDSSFIAVLTQERLHRLFVDNPALRFDHLLVDEAQNILTSNIRALELSQVILIARRRNPELKIAYYTPFLQEPEALRHVNGADHAVQSRTVHEQVKVERFFAGELGQPLHVFDQFLSRSLTSDITLCGDAASAVVQLAGERTIIYLNRPRDAQGLALELAHLTGAVTLSPLAETAIAAIEDLVDRDYSLIEVIRGGVLFHHGQIPEVLRQYVENLFREDHAEQRRYLVTTSTLLEGVNTPADTLILMSPGKGRGYLARSSFRNLVGRVARFSQIFAPRQPRLSLLLPRIYAIKTSYSRADWDPLTWLGDRADPSKPATDPINNPLLESGPKEQSRIEALERLENIEPGTSGLIEARLAATEFGRLSFKHGAHDFDVFRFERLIQGRLDERAGTTVSTGAALILLICEVFLNGVELVGDTDDLTRINDEPAARNYYSMFLSWRVDGAPMKLMLGRYLKRWGEQSSDWIWVGSKWGDEKKSAGEYANAYVRRNQKTRSELVNLAIVRIRADLDFLDYKLMKYLEILHALKLVDETFYLKLKYGTADERVITMLRNGMSFELARLVAESFTNYIEIDLEANNIAFRPSILAAMRAAGVNDILVFETRGILGGQV